MKRLCLLLCLCLLLASCTVPDPAETQLPAPAAEVAPTPGPMPAPTSEPSPDPYAWLGDPDAEDDHAAVEGLGHIPLEELPQETRDSLELAEEGPWEGMYAPEKCIRWVYTAPGLEIITTAPTAAYIELVTERDKDNRDLYPTEDDFWADIEGEEGREWIQRAIITDDSYATKYGLKVGMTVEEAAALGYPLWERQDFGAFDNKLEVTVEDGVVTEMQTWTGLGRYIGKFFEL